MSLLPASLRVSLSIQSIFAQLKQAYLKGYGFIFHNPVTLVPSRTPETLIINSDNIFSKQINVAVSSEFHFNFEHNVLFFSLILSLPKITRCVKNNVQMAGIRKHVLILETANEEIFINSSISAL